VKEKNMDKMIVGRSKPRVVPGAVGSTLLTAGSLFMVLLPSLASAGVTVSCAPTYSQSIVTLGDTLTTATLLLVNASDGAEAGGCVTLSNIKNTPACGNSGAGVDAVLSCSAANQDPDVFTVSATASGILPPGPNSAPGNATACVGRTFTVSVLSAATGELLLTPDMPIVLQPPGMAGSGCLLQFTSVRFNTLPKHDVVPGFPAMTNQLCRVTGTSSVNFLAQTNGGLSQVVGAELAPKQRGVAAMSHAGLLLATLTLVASGAFILRRRRLVA
jgi:hypothetical protein